MNISKSSQSIGYQTIGYRIKHHEQEDNPYKLVLLQNKYGLFVSISLDILEPHLLNIKYWKYSNDLGRTDCFVKDRFWVLPSKKDIFLESLHPNYWILLQAPGITVGDCCLNKWEKIGNKYYNVISSIALEEFHLVTFSDRQSYLIFSDDERFDDSCKVSITSREILEEFLNYFGRILMDK